MIESKTNFRNRHAIAHAAVVACSFLVCANASAQVSPWAAYLGLGHVQFDASANVSANGAGIPGGSAAASSSTGVAFGVIYTFNPDWSLELALGLPLTTTLSGVGTLEAAGKLGNVQYGPAVLSLRRSLPQLGSVHPYVGVGVNYTIVLSSKDGSVQSLDAKSAWGTVAQAGFELPLNKQWSLGLDFKKVWIRTTATGTLPALGGAAAQADVRLDPLISTFALIRKF